MENTKLKKITIALIILLFLSLCINVFGQSSQFPFEVKVSGKGKQSIVFIPGFACSSNVWDETKALYESSYTCYALTMAGFAGAAPQPQSGFQSWENAIAEFIRKNKLDQPIIIGHSMGGGMALALAADHPDLVGSIVVVDALPCLSALMNPTFKAAETPDCKEMIASLKAQSDEQFYQMQKSSIARLALDTACQRTVVGWSMHSDRETFAKLYCDFSNTDLRQKLANIRCPNLILLEAYFVNFKPAIQEQYQHLKGADLRYANQGLHFIMYDDKDWYQQQLANFIRH